MRQCASVKSHATRTEDPSAESGSANPSPVWGGGKWTEGHRRALCQEQPARGSRRCVGCDAAENRGARDTSSARGARQHPGARWLRCVEERNNRDYVCGPVGPVLVFLVVLARGGEVARSESKARRRDVGLASVRQRPWPVPKVSERSRPVHRPTSLSLSSLPHVVPRSGSGQIFHRASPANVT